MTNDSVAFLMVVGGGLALLAAFGAYFDHRAARTRQYPTRPVPPPAGPGQPRRSLSEYERKRGFLFPDLAEVNRRKWTDSMKRIQRDMDAQRADELRWGRDMSGRTYDTVEQFLADLDHS